MQSLSPIFLAAGQVGEKSCHGAYASPSTEDGVRGRLSAMDVVMRLLLPGAAEPEQRTVHHEYGPFFSYRKAHKTAPTWSHRHKGPFRRRLI